MNKKKTDTTIEMKRSYVFFRKTSLCHKYIRRARFSHVQCEQNASITLKKECMIEGIKNVQTIFYSLFISFSRHYIEFNEK